MRAGVDGEEGVVLGEEREVPRRELVARLALGRDPQRTVRRIGGGVEGALVARHTGRDAAGELLRPGLPVAVRARQRRVRAQLGEPGAGVPVLRADLVPAGLRVALLASGPRISPMRIGMALGAGVRRAVEIPQIMATGARHRLVLREEREVCRPVVERDGAPATRRVARRARQAVEPEVRVRRARRRRRRRDRLAVAGARREDGSQDKRRQTEGGRP
jgi:hypothetical protein